MDGAIAEKERNLFSLLFDDDQIHYLKKGNIRDSTVIEDNS